ncbi:hypothetical protein HPB50_010305 [Hyalomma asiaticum]|uniref:Uncharacterized protein n=1 Tax=Hyalomma asiaticum TaxID=266040 RepID=A0ACB7ST11_HYAAI|nr:hypothetical protein HPB50_010305 [Hyalomma asiaticum]
MATAPEPVRPSASTVVEHTPQTPLTASCGRGDEGSLPSRPGGDGNPSTAAASSPPVPTSQETGISYAQAAKKPRGARKPLPHPDNQRAYPKEHHGQELADMRLLLRAIPAFLHQLFTL